MTWREPRRAAPLCDRCLVPMAFAGLVLARASDPARGGGILGLALPVVRQRTRPAGAVPAAGGRGEGRGIMSTTGLTRILSREDLQIDETLGNLGKVLAFLKALQGRLGKVVDGPDGKPEYLLPPSVVETVERLAYLTGLSAIEREFVNACASDGLPDAWDGLAAYADWLGERGNDAGAARVRKLTPAPGDVLVFRCHAGTAHDAARAAESLAAELGVRGCPVTCTVLPAQVTLDRLPAARMAQMGWVRPERVAEEREACAREADRLGSHVAADAIRGREGNA